jgi:hypothetical protein
VNSNTVTSIGWAVHLTRCGHLDLPSHQVYGVNIVMPRAGKRDWDWYDEIAGDESGPEYNGVQAWADFQDLLRPWRWADVVWRVYGLRKEDEGAQWVRIARLSARSGVGEVQPDDADILTKALERDLEARTESAEFAFSLHPEALGETSDSGKLTGQSILHAVVPASHLQAGLSNAAFKLAGFLSVPNELVQGIEHVVAFPELRLERNGNLVRPQSLLPSEISPPAVGIVRGRYGKLKDSEIEVMFACRSEKTAVATASKREPGAARYLAPSRVWPLVADRLTPLGVLGRVIPAERSKMGSFAVWRATLWSLLSVGWLPRYRGRRRGSEHTLEPHVFEYVSPQRIVTDVFGDEWPPRPNGLADEALRGFLKARAEELPEGGLRGDLLKLADNPEGGPESAWYDAWDNVAGRVETVGRMGEVLPAFWYQFAKFPGAKDEGEKADRWIRFMKAIAAVATPDVQEQMILGALDRAEDRQFLGPFREVPTREGGVDQWKQTHMQQVKERVKKLALSSLKDSPSFLKELENATDGFLVALGEALKGPVRMAKDPGVPIVFDPEDPSSGSIEADTEIRGYAIALRSGLKKDAKKKPLWDQGRAGWITNAAVGIEEWPEGGKRLKLVRRKAVGEDNNQIFWMTRTVGSSSSGGERKVSIDYEGAPLCAVVVDGDALMRRKEDQQDDFKRFFEDLWPLPSAKGLPVPLLGYGQYYAAVSTALDNAGGVVDARLRSETDGLHAELSSTPFSEADSEDSLAVPQYLSREVPGSPVLKKSVPAEAYALSAETCAHALLAGRGEPIPKVVLLAHAQTIDVGGAETRLFKPERVAPSSRDLVVVPPDIHFEFVRRWLATDCLLLEKASIDPALRNLLSDPQFKDLEAGALFAFRDEVVDPEKRKGFNGEPPLYYHPGVSAIGVAVWYDGKAMSDEPDDSRCILFARTRLKDGKLEPTQHEHAFQVRSDHTAVKNALTENGLTLRCGSFACVRFYSLVEETLFGTESNSACRYNEGLGKDGSGKAIHPGFSHGGKLYRAFGPLEQWFEVAPKWPENSDQTYSREFMRLELEPPGMMGTSRARLQAVAPGVAGRPVVPADWLRGLQVTRHEWHWSGYPVNLPSTGPDPEKAWDLSLQRALEAFPGVESHRDSFGFVFRTRHAKGASPAWEIGSADGNGGWRELVESLALPDGERPSRYAAYVAEVAVRFRAWLGPVPGNAHGPLSLERMRFASGGLLRGIARGPGHERLPAPAMFPAIPLAGTFEADPDGGLPHRVTNGCLLVIMEPLRRTDPTTRIGGLGDVLELDLVQTRPVFRKEEPRIDIKSQIEIGPNPIFHKAPSTTAPVGGETHRLRLGPLFGLTADQVRNAAVGQTAVIVHRENVPGGADWLMAKGRLRRIVLPETLLNGNLEKVCSPSMGGCVWKLPVRVEGGERVPVDFCVDLPAKFGIPEDALTIKGSDGRHYPIRVPTVAEDAGDESKRRRILCSWHRDRWVGVGDATWRIQVLLQEGSSEVLRWDQVAKLGCHDQVDWNPKMGGDPLELSMQSANIDRVDAHRVMLSNYSDSFWMTFIGTFGGTSRLRADQHRLRMTGSGSGSTFRLEPEGVGDLEPPPTEPKDWQSEKVEFHLILLFRPATAISRGAPDTTAGELVAVLRPEKSGSDVPFVFLPGDKERVPDVKGCHGYLCAFQRISAPSKEEMDVKIGSWDELIGAMFPEAYQGGNDVDPPGNRESLVRALPKHLGPFEIVDDNP